ncbi:SDR family NAD(P)-dependent oxidoreductase [Pedobacter mucosus]|uniref:SDR family NAD(P)-dependent oxidoreductase n=1 Tax=Pedobacter mucosus TaxID=2895286 RepID=UPI001EE4B598|nr:SDR family oxidoreductase [Pedobacter mucosus]UKT65381.1 SDR family oxidoreductase [Pedobacter mucosus]
MNLDIKGKVAIITGADSGIGLETAKRLAEGGATIILADLKEEELQKAVGEVKAFAPNVTVTSVTVDITDNESVLRFAKQVKEDFNGAHILVNCAGARGAAGDFLTLTDEDWQETIDADLLGAVRLCRAFIPQLQENGWGRVVLVASENAYQPYEEESPYNACKAGIINLSKCLSRAYSKDGLLFNCVSPAFIATPMTDAMMDDLAKEHGTSREEAIEWFLKNKRPNLAVGRRGEPGEVANVIAFLSSNLASFVNGSNYRIDGGAVESAF